MLGVLADVRFPMPATLAFFVPQGQPEISQLRSGWAGGRTRSNFVPQGTTETVTTNIFHRNQPRVSGETPHILPERSLSGDAPLDSQCIP